MQVKTLIFFLPVAAALFVSAGCSSQNYHDGSAVYYHDHSQWDHDHYYRTRVHHHYHRHHVERPEGRPDRPKPPGVRPPRPPKPPRPARLPSRR